MKFMRILRQGLYSRGIFLLFIAGVTVILFLCWAVSVFRNKDTAKQLKHNISKSAVILRTENKSINLTCDFINVEIGDKIQISIQDSVNKVVAEKYVTPENNKFQFKEGVHGNKYFVFASLLRKDKVVETLSGNAMFLDYEKMPKFHVLMIDTYDGKNVRYEKVSPPKECWGATLRNNEYSDARLQIFKSGRLVDDKQVKIKARGNTSAYGDKLPYMVRFNEDYVLNSNDGKCLSRRWILLNFDDLQFVFGNYINKMVQGFNGSKYCFVNVLFNGDYKGSYIAVEPVSDYLLRDRVISKTGIVIENDPYWWNEGLWFKTPKQIYPLAYTFKYPKISNKIDWRYTKVKAFVCDYEKMLFQSGDEYLDFIDQNSFVNWLFVHDIMQTWDGGGSNMFMYLKDLDDKSKLTMGPSWDFDSWYGERVCEKWEDVHSYDILHFPILFEKKSFVRRYERRWENLCGNIFADTKEYFIDFEEQYADDVDESWHLNYVRWGGKQFKVSDRIFWILCNLNNRLDWMNKKIKAKEYVK